MEVRLIVDVNIDTGEWEITYKNISDPGKPMEYNKIMSVLKKILNEHDAKIDCEGCA